MGVCLCVSGMYGCVYVCLCLVCMGVSMSVSGVYECVCGVPVKARMPGVKQLMGDNCIVVLTDFIVCSYFP